MRSLDDVQVQDQQQEAALRRKSRAGSSPTRRRRSREEEVGAPAVWIAPDWATHPIIESFYGMRVMCSPMNATATTTLGESCCSYKATGEEDEGQDSIVGRAEAAESPLYDRHAAMGASGDSSVCSSSGFAQWNRMRHTMNLNGGLVPESLQDMDTRIAEEHKRLNQAQKVVKKSKKQPAAPANVMWSLLCGARTDGASQADGLAFLTEKLGMAVSNRALNQLQRHRRHVRGILQIVTAHNPDLELTERQLDSFEAADAMLVNDIKYSVLKQQYKLLVTSATQRRRAVAQAKLHNGNDCFEKPHVKSVMLSKLLEAVSWYRLVQRNAREEAASSSVGVASAPGSSVSSAPSSGGLQELQVDKILDVLAGEEFYSDYNELMCQSDWWEIAQAHFENLIFSSKNSRICQWVLQLSKDVAAVSYEELDENERGRLRSRTNSMVGGHTNTIQQASWTKDPPPEQILDFLERLTGRVRREFDVPADVSKSLNVFIQRQVWRKKCVELGGLPMENLGVSPELYQSVSTASVLVRAIEAFNGMESVVPCDLLDELMHGVVILHHEAALVLGTTQFSVETFFPLLAYVLVHCRLPTIHAQLHLLENFAITADNANGEESYTSTVSTPPSIIANPGSTVSSTSSAVSMPGGSPVVPIISASPPKNHTAFSLELELESELE
ncbi:VPS9 domain [Phytophthora cactorum]|nr:VPS9 domain [Phytophthora cactorum]